MSSLGIGDLAPRFVCPDHNGNDFDLLADDVAGKPLALVLCRNGLDAERRTLAQLATAYERIRVAGGDVLALTPEPVAKISELKHELGLPFPVLSNAERSVFQAYDPLTDAKERDSGTIVLLRANGHVLDVAACADEPELLAKRLTQEGRVQRNGAEIDAPVLVVPDVLSRADCRRLIRHYEESDAPLVPLSDASSPTRDVKAVTPDYGRRDRIDHMFAPSETLDFLAGRVQARLLPEVKKAFQYDVKSFEALRIACYEGVRGGAAHGHRDNSRANVAHRRFAVSLNLNSEEFEGGELSFPEYSVRKYKPDTGAAFVFSCSILHEALQVCSGKRYVLLMFLF